MFSNSKLALVGQRFYDPKTECIFIITHKDSSNNFSCLKYSEKFRFEPRVVNVLLTAFNRMFILNVGENVEESRKRLTTGKNNFMLIESEEYSEKVLSTFKLFPTEIDLQSCFNSEPYSYNAKELIKTLLVNYKVYTDHGTYLVIKEI